MVSPPDEGVGGITPGIFFCDFWCQIRIWGQFGTENKLIEGQPNEYDVICRNTSVLAFHLWPTIFAERRCGSKIFAGTEFNRVPAALHPWFWVWTRLGSRKYVLGVVPDPQWEGAFLGVILGHTQACMQLMYSTLFARGSSDAGPLSTVNIEIRWWRNSWLPEARHFLSRRHNSVRSCVCQPAQQGMATGHFVHLHRTAELKIQQPDPTCSGFRATADNHNLDSHTGVAVYHTVTLCEYCDNRNKWSKNLDERPHRSGHPEKVPLPLGDPCPST